VKNGFAIPTLKKVGALKINRLQRIARPGATVRGSWMANLLSKSNAVLRTPLSTYHPITASENSVTKRGNWKDGRRDRKVPGRLRMRLFPVSNRETGADYFAFASRLVCIRSVGLAVNRSIAGCPSDCPSRDSSASSFKREPQSGKKTMKAEVLDCFWCALLFELGLLPLSTSAPSK